MAFTALNDLSIRYVFPLIIEDEKQIIQLIIASADILKHDIEAYELMAEVVDHERLHLQLLQLASEPRRLTTGDISIPANRRMPARSAVKERLHVRSGAGWITHFPTNVTTEPKLPADAPQVRSTVSMRLLLLNVAVDEILPGIERKRIRMTMAIPAR